MQNKTLKREFETAKTASQPPKIEYQSSTGAVDHTRENAHAPDVLTGGFLSPLLVSDREAAHLLGISRSVLREYLAHNIIHQVRLPHPSGVGFINRTLVSVTDLQAFVERCKHA